MYIFKNHHFCLRRKIDNERLTFTEEFVKVAQDLQQKGEPKKALEFLSAKHDPKLRAQLLLTLAKKHGDEDKKTSLS